jgi:hypothetical protein
MSESDALRLVVEGTASGTGVEFFRALVKNLAAVMGTAGAWVTEYLPEARRLRAPAFWLNGAFPPAYEHPVDGTPCRANVEEKRLLQIPDRMWRLIPPRPACG